LRPGWNSDASNRYGKRRPSHPYAHVPPLLPRDERATQFS